MTRLVTYNVHRCVGTDRRLDLGRIVEVLAACEADVICLQELDVGRARTGGTDQAQAIADRLAMDMHFHAALTVETEQYGDAILTRLPERLVRKARLPILKGVPGLEPRGALWVTVEVEGHPVHILNTHLGLVPREQHLQAEALIGPLWLGHPQCTGPTILAGDFNVTSISRTYGILCSRLTDAQRRIGLQPTVKTFPSGFPTLRIDHAFVSAQVDILGISAPLDARARSASDHLPLVMDFRVSAADGAA
ncbi:MAG: endonuclease/exonuclease/phosphatase family protein [Brevundimonas sp.]|nr:MAG: endonuclease/exonuclease/phosphatase family protein [Brevundimonas sp.]